MPDLTDSRPPERADGEATDDRAERPAGFGERAAAEPARGGAGYRTLEEIKTEAERRGLRLAFFVTALPLELAAVRAHLTNMGAVRAFDGTILECGTFDDRGQEWLIVSGETRAGTHNAQQVVSTAHFTFQPVGRFELMIFIGVGGSRKKGAPIGSVVAADKVYYPYGGKYSKGVLANRPTSVIMDHELTNIAQKVCRDETWPSRIIPSRLGPKPDDEDYPVEMPPPAKVAPIASIEAVLDDPKSELEALLKSSYGDTHVVEMEGYGAVFGAHTVRTPGMIVRGVSDMTNEKDEDEDEVNQPVAATHAAAFAFEMLSHWGLNNDPPRMPHGAAGEASDADERGGPNRGAPTRAGQTGAAEGGGRAGDHGGGGRPSSIEVSVVLNLSADFGPDDEERIERLGRTLKAIAGSSDVEIVEVRSGSLHLFVADPGRALARVGEARLREALLEAEDVELVGMSTIEAWRSRDGLMPDLDAASEDLLGWPATLPGGERLERPELDQLAARITDSASSTTAVIGPPGAGKSALLATLGKRFRAAGWPVLAIKADLLDPDVASEGDLRERLGLGVNPSDALRGLAAFGPVLLVVDQLDALAGYLDIKTARLSILLNLVRRLGRVDNVHIVLSSRTFEFQHDVRLRAVGAESVTLQLPPWDEVLAVLAANGVVAAGWPADAKEVMRSPQALSTYLSLNSRYSSEPFASYQLMLDRLWDERVLAGGDGGERDRLASDIAEEMADRESLWLASARFADRSAAMQALTAAGILTTLDASVGFSHQTLFEFTLARSFAREPGRLSTFATERQDSLFLRPKLWAGLTYLRGADRDLYHRELETIWRTEGLRSHLRVLLVDFLGSQPDPTDREAILMDAALTTEATRLRAFRALAGSPGWFERLADSRIAPAMRQEGAVANAQIEVLTRALPSAPRTVVRLIRENWLPRVEDDPRSWSVIQWISPWTDEALAIALRILSRTDIASSMVDHQAASIAVSQPVEALRLVEARLDRELEAASTESAARMASAPPPPDDAAPDEALALRVGERARDPVRNLIERSSDWDGLAGIAETWPRETLDGLWPWFTRALAALDRVTERHQRVGYPLGFEADFRFEGENALDLPEGSILGALRVAAERLADTDPAAFRDWAARADAVELTAAQRLIAHGIAHRPAEFAPEGLAFVLDDERRYFLGPFQAPHATTERMVAAVSPYWTPDQVRAFEERVRSYAPPPPPEDTDPKDRIRWRHMVRRTQLGLLRALPARQRSAAASRQVDEDERRYGSHRGITYSGVRTIGSVIEAEGIAKAKDDDIVNAFVELPDATGWDNPRNWMVGGNVQLSRAFASFAKGHPDRALRILSRLDASNGVRAAAYAIDALSEAAPADTVSGLIRDANGRGFDSDEFRHSVARALDRMARRKVEVDEDLIGLLEGWVRDPLPEDREPDDDDGEGDSAGDPTAGENSQQEDDRDPVERSSLWGHGSFGVFPGGDVPIADSIVHIRLLRGQADRALAFLSDYLDRQKGIAAWDILAQYLPHLAAADPKAREAFLDRLLDEVAGVTGSAAYSQFLARSQAADHALVERHIDAWRTSPSPTAKQAYGEIVALDALLRPERGQSASRLEAIMDGPAGSPAQTGAALTAAHVLVEEPGRRDAAAALLARSLRNGGAGAWTAALELFRLSDELVADDATTTLLRAIADGLPTSPSLDATFIVDRLATLLPHSAALVGEIALALAEKWNTDLADVRTSIAMASAALVDLAITLHRLGPETRETGLRLFEALIGIDAYEARQTLDEIDNRFRENAPVARPRLRRRAQVAPRRVRRHR